MYNKLATPCITNWQHQGVVYLTILAAVKGLRPGTGKINICHWNYSAKLVSLPKQTTVGEITPADVSVEMLAQEATELEGSKREITIKKNKNKGQTKVLDKIDLSGLEDEVGLNRKKPDSL